MKVWIVEVGASFINVHQTQDGAAAGAEALLVKHWKATDLSWEVVSANRRRLSGKVNNARDVHALIRRVQVGP